MTLSDLEQLLSMGFEQARAELAVKKTGNLQGSLEWLEENQDKSLEEIQAEAEENKSAAADASGAQARSWVCNECDKRFRTTEALEFHAHKSGHTDFAESTDEIAPLTEEERNARLTELREKLKNKKATQAVQDLEDNRKNEKIRQKATREAQDTREDLKRKKQLEELSKKKAEQQAEKEHKKAVLAKIEEDKARRRELADLASSRRTGASSSAGTSIPQAAAVPATAAQSETEPSVPSVVHNEARLRVQWNGGQTTKKLDADTTLFELAQSLEEEFKLKVTKFEMTYPRKVFTGDLDFSKTLREVGLVPSAVLRV